MNCFQLSAICLSLFSIASALQCYQGQTAFKNDFAPEHMLPKLRKCNTLDKCCYFFFDQYNGRVYQCASQCPPFWNGVKEIED
ncbi:hypothetical protein PMAYCL1PPCAC_04660, partial [Pristionchus mayeri]